MLQLRQTGLNIFRTLYCFGVFLVAACSESIADHSNHVVNGLVIFPETFSYHLEGAFYKTLNCHSERFTCSFFVLGVVSGGDWIRFCCGDVRLHAVLTRYNNMQLLGKGD